MKFLVSACDAQLWVDSGSKEDGGDPQWHAGVDPRFVEASLVIGPERWKPVQASFLRQRSAQCSLP